MSAQPPRSKRSPELRVASRVWQKPAAALRGRAAAVAARGGVAHVAAGAECIGRPRTLLAIAALAGATALDIACAVGLTGEKGQRNTARADYRDRSGFPKGLQAARGAARVARQPSASASAVPAASD